MVKRIVAATALVLLGLVVSGCGADSDDPAGVDAEAAVQEVFDSLGGRAQLLSFVSYVEHLAGAPPNREVSLREGHSVPLSDGIVVGRVVKAERGGAFSHPEQQPGEEEAPGGTPVGWGDESVAWRDATVTVDVERLWSSTLPDDTESIRLRVPVVGSLPPDDFVAALGALDRVVVVLSGVDDQVPGTRRYNLLWEGSTLGVVDDDDALSFPAMDPESEAAFMGKLTTVAAIDRAARRDPSTIVVRKGVVVSR